MKLRVGSINNLAETIGVNQIRTNKDKWSLRTKPFLFKLLRLASFVTAA